MTDKEWIERHRHEEEGQPYPVLGAAICGLAVIGLLKCVEVIIWVVRLWT